MATGAAILYQDRAGEGEEKTRKKKAASKTKYTCPCCGLNAWAKPEAPLICGDCDEHMEAEPEPEAQAVPGANGKTAPHSADSKAIQSLRRATGSRIKTRPRNPAP